MAVFLLFRNQCCIKKYDSCHFKCKRYLAAKKQPAGKIGTFELILQQCTWNQGSVPAKFKNIENFVYLVDVLFLKPLI